MTHVMPEKRAQRAKRYRLLADEIRNSADGMKTESRLVLLRLADDYDLLAEKLDTIDARTKKKSS
jgi:hypothetical protein